MLKRLKMKIQWKEKTKTPRRSKKSVEKVCGMEVKDSDITRILQPGKYTEMKARPLLISFVDKDEKKNYSKTCTN